jgi:acylphosphatase
MTAKPNYRKLYSTDIEGNAPVQVRFAISGRMNARSYLAFVAERADWLAIKGWAAANDGGSITLVAAGPEALVGALEMACTLGPLDAVIESIQVANDDSPIPQGFEIRA